MTGLSMVSILDPATNTNVTITGALYQQMLMIMLIISGMYRYLIKALADSFTIIPVNGAAFQMHFLLRTMLEFMKDYMVIGFRITLPVFIVSFTMNIVLGILAKVSPQLNMFAVGMQLKILVGLGILFLTSSMLSIASDFVFDQMKILIQEFAYGLTP
jgi:flagellar biosynthetic protein FliR